MKNQFKKLFLIFVLFISMIGSVMAQVTTSGMSGRITGGDESLPGAVVIAVHVPSGTQYMTITNTEGRFYLQGMRTGGPYKVDISFVGYATATLTEINLSLGETFILNTNLKEELLEVGEITVVGVKPSAFSTDKTGAATNISSRELNTLPTISRSINDFTRLSPLAGSGSTFGGRDGRLNNINIDGSNFNNNFGLSSNNMPGGDAQPISLDAIEEIQVNVAPFDVRQANFTGAGINAVTKSGTNKFAGSAYTLYRDESFNGSKVDGVDLPEATKTSTNVYGLRLGGPIIKNKLFFFVNGEYEKESVPGMEWLAAKNGREGSNVTRVKAEDLESFSNYLQTNYNYATGPYENYGAFAKENYKILARLDWNISRDHKFSLRYNSVESTNDQLVNGTSSPNPRGTSNRTSKEAMSFKNSNYGFLNVVNSLSAELKSTFGNHYSNQLLATYTHIEDTRNSGSSIFPFIDIMDGTATADGKSHGNNYMSAGYELFTYNNNVLNNVYTITDNFTSYLGKHTLTSGLSFEYLSFGNSYMRYATSYYRFKDLNTFLNNGAPLAFGTTYSLLPDGKDPVAELDFGQFSAYIQDEFNVSDNFKLTYGVRMDLPQYFNTLIDNPAVQQLTFYDGEKINLGSWPGMEILWSPRMGFNWDVFGNKSLKVRGGTGIFTGRLPFVFFTNQPTNSGMLQNTVEVTKTSDLATLKFNPDPKYHLSNTTLFPNVAGTKAPGSIAGIDKNFKMPQVWRSNLATDIKLPLQMMLTLEGIYTKDINAIVQRNANLTASDPTKTYSGPDKRPIWSTTKVVSSMSEAMVLDNTDQGYSYSFTSQLTFPVIKNLNGMIAYTHTESKDITGNPGSQAASAWSNNPSVRGQNDLDLSYSQYMTPNRVVGSFSYKLEYLKKFASTLSLYYSGYNDGNFSYRYTSDFNKDGVNADLIYIPKDASEIIFEDIKNTDGTVRHTAQVQSDAFFAYIDQDSYLSKNKGKYAERNGAQYPWYNRVDLKFLQDFYVNTKNSKNTLQLSCDVLNFANLLNSSWGVRQRQIVSNGAILKYTKLNSANVPMFQMAEISNKLPVATFENTMTTSSTWGIQIGVRYIFN
jgi:hypothetical protein